MAKLKEINWLGMVFSCVALYFLAPTLDRTMGGMISSAFALLNIYAARSFLSWRMHIRSFFYLLISVGTYYILFNDEPWQFFLYGGMFDSSALPLIVCSIIMTVAGWLLLRGWKARAVYIFITLGLQIPLGLLIGTEKIQELFSGMSRSIVYFEHYSGSLEFWQFEWMLTYHLPFYFLSRLPPDPKEK